MIRSTIAMGLLLFAILWVLGLSSLSHTGAQEQPVSIPAQDGSQAVIKFLDKSRFYDRDPVTSRAGEITLRMDILDATKKPLYDLKKDNIEVIEEQYPGLVKSFKGPATQAVNVILVLDVSGSMSEQGKMEGAKRAALAAVSELKLDRDRLGIITFDHKHYLIQPLTVLSAGAKTACEQKVAELRPRGGTEIGPPTLEALQIFAHEKPDGLKMVLVMTDGEDNHLPGFIGSIGDLSDKQGVPVHSIAFGTPLVPAAKGMLEDLATRCKGQFQHAPGNSELAAMFRTRVMELSNECTVVYDSPYPEADGLPRKVQVTVKRPNGTLTALTEYQIGPILAGGRRSAPVVAPTPGASTLQTQTPASTSIKVPLFLGLLITILAALLAPSAIEKVSNRDVANQVMPASAASLSIPSPPPAPIPAVRPAASNGPSPSTSKPVPLPPAPPKLSPTPNVHAAPPQPMKPIIKPPPPPPRRT